MRVPLFLAALCVAPPVTAQTTPTPQPICSFFVMMNVARHHMHCSADNRPLEAELQTLLHRYAIYISRNGPPTQADMFNSINTILSTPLEPHYACADDAPHVALHDAFAANPARVQPTADLHLTVDRPVVLDVDAECTPSETN